MKDVAEPDPWAKLRLATKARIGLGRTGDAMSMGDVLAFQFAHAKARDAVQAPLDIGALKAELPDALVVKSAAPTREIYLRRPDLGRQIDPSCLPLLQHGNYDAVFVIADGLSAEAVMQNALPVLRAMQERLKAFKIAPPVIASQARVAIGDDIGAALGAKLCAVLIGERPGLSVAQSLGIYLTYAPVRGTQDSARNCISNVHGQGGLSTQAAADMLSWLMHEALQRKLTGVGLKEASGAMLPAEIVKQLG